MTRRPGPADRPRLAILGPTATLLLALLLQACGTGAPGPNGTSTRPSAPSGSGAGRPDLTLPSFPDPTASAPAEMSGAKVRVVNAWSSAEGPGPSIVLRTEDATLLEVAPGETSEFTDIPKRNFSDLPAHIEVIRGDDLAGHALQIGELQPGDRVTAIVYKELESGTDLPILAIDPVWEVGEPFYGLPWPDVPDDLGFATLAAYSGPLLGLPREWWNVGFAAKDGTCLADADGRASSSFGGDGAQFVLLPTGTTELALGTKPSYECQLADANVGTAVITAGVGDRVGLILWAPLGVHEFMVLPMEPGG